MSCHVLGEGHTIVMVNCMSRTKRFHRRQLNVLVLIVNILNWLIKKIDWRSLYFDALKFLLDLFHAQVLGLAILSCCVAN